MYQPILSFPIQRIFQHDVTSNWIHANQFQHLRVVFHWRKGVPDQTGVVRVLVMSYNSSNEVTREEIFLEVNLVFLKANDDFLKIKTKK